MKESLLNLTTQSAFSLAQMSTMPIIQETAAFEPGFDVPQMLMIGASILLGALVVHFVFFKLMHRVYAKDPGSQKHSVLKVTYEPARWVAIFAAVMMIASFLPFDEEVMAPLKQWLRAGLIVMITWTLVAAVRLVDDIIYARHDIHARDNLRARSLHTRAVVLTRTGVFMLILAGGAGVLMSFPIVRQIGIGLFSAAGVAGLAIGLAARPALANLVAGVQLAITEPIRLDDAVIVEGEWGWIEEINATYVVIKIWDERRLIVPLSHFIEQPFQNWTRTRAELIGSVVLYVDYRCPVDALAEELKRQVEAHPLWDRRVQVLQVIDTTQTTMQLRALMSAGDSPSCWDLRCDIRKALIAWLQKNYPESLPKYRLESQPAREVSESEPDATS